MSRINCRPTAPYAGDRNYYPGLGEFAVTKLTLPAPPAEIDFDSARDHARRRSRRQTFTRRIVQGEFTWIASPEGHRPKRYFEPAVDPGSSKMRLPMVIIALVSLTFAGWLFRHRMNCIFFAIKKGTSRF